MAASRVHRVVLEGRTSSVHVDAGVTAAPLLTMPLVYVLRRADKRLSANLEPELRVTRQAGYVGVRARY